MLKEVVKFEIARSLKKPSFWVAAILLPVVLVGYVLFAGFSGISAEQTLMENGNLAGKRVSVLDEGALINPEFLKDVNVPEDKNKGIEDVKSGAADVFYFVPAGFETPVEIYSSSDVGSFLTDYKTQLAEWLKASVMGELTEQQVAALAGSYQVEDIRLSRDDKAGNELGSMAAPIAGLVIFYVLICLFGNRLTMATIEEKENRITEMLLTSISAKTLIVGKIVSLILLGFLQVLVLMVPMILIFIIAQQKSIGGIDLSAIIPQIELSPWGVLTSLVLLLLSYVLFVGLCVFVGTLVSTAKEVSSYSGVMMILVIMPMFFLSSFLAVEPTTITHVLSFFPFSAPVSLFLRFAFGTLQWWEMALGMAVIAVSAALIIRQAIRAFQFGAVGLSSRINLREAFLRK